MIRRLSILLLSCALSCTVALGSITVAVTHRDGSGATVAGRPPLGVVFESSGTTSTHTYTTPYQGARWGFAKRTDITYTQATKTLGPASAFALYYPVGTQFIQLEKSGSVTLGWYSVASKSADGIVLTSDLNPGGDLTGVTAYQAIQSPFRQLIYDWTFTGASGFNNPNPITGGTISTSMFRGPNTTMVWETDGTATLLAYDYANDEVSTAFVVTVDVTDWTGSTDYYVSSSGNDTTGDGSIGNPYLTWSKGVTQVFAGAGPKRVFFKAGETINSGGSASTNSNTGPRYIGSYGAGAAPIINCSATPLTSSSGNNTLLTIEGLTFQTSGGTLTYCLRIPWSKILVRRVTITNGPGFGFNVGMGPQSSTTGDHSDLMLVDNNISAKEGSGEYAVTLFSGITPDQCARRGIVANIASSLNSNTEHGMRGASHKSCFAYNTITKTKPGGSGTCVFRFSGTLAIESNYVAFNKFVGSGTATSAICLSTDPGPPVGSCTNMLIDSNYVHFNDTAAGTTIGVQVVHTDGLTLRNNIFDGHTSVVSTATFGQVAHIEMLNNTFYSTTTFSAALHTANGTDNGVDGLVVVNNIVSLPACASGSVLVRNNGGDSSDGGTVIHANLFNAANGTHTNVGNPTGTSRTFTAWSSFVAATPYFMTHTNLGGTAGGAVDPLFVDVSAHDFRLQATSPAITAGIAIPTINKDFGGVARPSGAGIDIGAWEYVAPVAGGSVLALLFYFKRRRRAHGN